MTHASRRHITPAFATPDWSAVLTAARSGAPQARESITRLCRAFWRPLYAYVRLRGYSPEDAQELTHAFFARLAATDILDEMTDEGLRLRDFLLTSLDRFLDGQSQEGRPPLPQSETEAAEKLFEQNWALAVLNVVYDRLRFEYETADKGDLFEVLKFCLNSPGDAFSYSELAAKIGAAETTAKVLVGRLRQRFGEILREEVGHSVANPADVDMELHRLFHSLST